MKRILLTMFVALALLGCKKEQPDTPKELRYPILFGSSETRAVADIDALKANGFKVYAYFEGNIVNTSATFEKKVTHSVQNGSSIWGFGEGETEYWIPGATYWFRAFYPAEPTSCTLTVDNTNSVQDYTIENFDITKQEDIMVAASGELAVADDATAPSTGSVVDLNFQHLLACVAIKIESEINDVLVRSVTLSGVAQYGDYDGTWMSDNTASVKIDSGVTLSANVDAVDVTKGGILVIPANAKDIMLIVEANKTYELDIPEITWAKGMKYTYTMKIEKNNITFVDNIPYSDEWDSESATGSVIIK